MLIVRVRTGLVDVESRRFHRDTVLKLARGKLSRPEGEDKMIEGKL